MAVEQGFDWQSHVRAYSEPGLSSCVSDGSLTLDGRRVASTVTDLYALRLVEWAIERGQSIVVCPPEPFSALPALAAAAAHVSSIVSHHEETGRSAGSNRRVAVVTSSARLRGIYRRLGVGTAPLVEVVPAAVRSSSGTISVIGSDPGRGWSTVFVARPSEARALEGVDLTVIELPVHEDFDPGEFPGPVVVVAPDPADPKLARLRKAMPVFAWSDADLARLPKVGLQDGPALREDRLRLERAAIGIECRCVPVPHQRVCESAALFWADIGELIRAAQRSPLGRELAAAAFVLFYDLIQLAVPIDYYEAVTRPLRVRLREIENAHRLVDGDLRDIYVPIVAEELRDMATAIGLGTAKPEVMAGLLREHVAEGQDVLLVARTAELARVYRTYLETMGDLAGSVRVASLRGIADQPPADVAVLTGLLPRYARYLYTTGIATQILGLGYEAESPLASVPGGFTEHRHMRSALAFQLAYSEWLARDAAKAACWTALSGEPSAVPDDRPEPPRVEAIDGGAVDEGRQFPDVPPGLWDGVGAPLAGIEGRLQRDLPPRLSPADDGQALDVEAVRVGFGDGRWMFLEKGASATRWDPRTMNARAGHPVARLNPGDELLLLDGEVKKDLLGKVLEVAEDVPELAGPAAWVDYWRDTLDRAYRKFGSYEALREALGRLGCLRQAQTVRLWVVGDVIGPEDPEDIRRLGECAGDEPLTANYLRVGDAMRALRSAHQQLGRRLGGLMRDLGPAAAEGRMAEDEIIDETSGLSASDFRDSIEILRISSVEDAGVVPFALTGLLREREAEGAKHA